jgi:hypothetical protein
MLKKLKVFNLQNEIRKELERPSVIEFVNWTLTQEREFYLQDGHDKDVVYQADIENFLALKYPTKENA